MKRVRGAKGPRDRGYRKALLCSSSETDCRMANNTPKIAVFAGTFDPPTYGHLDIIQRSQRLFARTVVAVGRNPEKRPLFSQEERVDLLRQLVGDLTDVEVEAYAGLTMDYVRRKKADVIVKGIRDSDDLRNELRQANVNMIAGDVETVFLFTTDTTALISGTLIRQICELGGLDSANMNRLIPPLVIDALRKKLDEGDGGGSSARNKRTAG